MAVYVWSKVALPDPAEYYYGFKDPRVLSYGEINRALSDDRGNYEGADFSFTVADTDRLVRGLMAGESTKYGVRNRNVAIRMISDADRRLLRVPRTIARGVTRSVVPMPDLQARFECIDFVTSKFVGTHTNKQIPVRVWGTDFPGAPIEARGLAVPIIYGAVSDEASASAAPVPTVMTSEGGFIWEGYYNTGNGQLESDAAVPTGVSAGADAPGSGALNADVPNGEYGVIVTAVDALGRESDPHVFYSGGPGDGRGSFAFGPIPGIPVDGTQSITVSWAASAGAVAYRVYLAYWYYGPRWQQWIQVAAPTTTVTFTQNPDWSTATTVDNFTPGAQLINFGQAWWYAVQAVLSDGVTGVSVPIFGGAGPFRRPIRVRWLAVPGALEYRIVRRTQFTDFDRQWSVPSTQLYFDDDLLDTGVTYLTGALTQPRGAVPVTYLGQTLDDSGYPWETFGICGHAVAGITAWFLDGIRVDTGTAGLTWLIPGFSGVYSYNLYFAASGPDGRYRDINGSRYTLIYARGPDAAAAIGADPDIPHRPLTVNVSGIEAAGDGTGALITDLLQQYKHFVINWGFQTYETGGWLPTPTWAPEDPGVSKINEASFDAASALALARLPAGYVGAGIIGNHGEQLTLREWMARFNLSANVDCGFNRNNQFFVSMLTDDFSALTGAVHFTQLQDILAETFTVTPQPDKHFNVHPYSYRRRWRDDTWELENAEVFDALSIVGYRAELIAPLTELWFVRDMTTASDVMMRRLMLSKEPPLYVTFKAPLLAFNTDIGDLILVSHAEGISDGGWTGKPLRVLRHSLNPNDFTIRMECQYVGHIFSGMFILGDETELPASWLDTNLAEQVYGYLGDDTTAQFSNGDPAKRLR